MAHPKNPNGLSMAGVGPDTFARVWALKTLSVWGEDVTSIQPLAYLQAGVVGLVIAQARISSVASTIFLSLHVARVGRPWSDWAERRHVDVYLRWKED